MHQHPSIRLELARQRHDDFLVEARSARLAASVRDDSPVERSHGSFGQALRELAARMSTRPAPRRAGLTAAS